MSKKITLELEETDLYNALKTIIKHENSTEIVKLLTPFIGNSPECTKWLFKLMFGKKLPDIIPVGTICLTNVNNLTYEIDRIASRASGLCDSEGMIACTIVEFKGYHDWRHFEVTSQGIDGSGNQRTFKSYLMVDQLELLEEF